MTDTIGPKVEVKLKIPPLISNTIADRRFQLVIQKRYCSSVIPKACKTIFCEECLFYKTNLDKFIKWKKENGSG